MSISADTLQLLMEAGLQGESLLTVVRSIEADTAKPSPADRTSAERQRRYRARRDNGGMTGHQWKRVSARVLAGSDYRCAYCDAEASHCDHVQPLLQGGGNEESNLVACCVGCNSAKAGKTLEQWKGEAWAQSWRDKRRNVTALPAPSFLSLSPTPPNPNQSTPNPPPYSPPAPEKPGEGNSACA
jgi:5-methylcytosine-specific restriction endonuclease McrA